MEHVVETTVLLFLGILVIGLAISLIQPQIEESRREALFNQALSIARDLHQSIENVALAGEGNSVTLRVTLPEDTSLVGDPNGAWLNISVYNPPKNVESGPIVVHVGAVSNLTISGTPQGNVVISIVMNTDKGWSVIARGLATTGAPIDIVVKYPIGKPKTIQVDIQGGG